MVNTMFIEVGSLSITRIRSFRFREFFFFSRSTIKCTFFDERVISSKSCLINEILIQSSLIPMIEINGWKKYSWICTRRGHLARSKLLPIRSLLVVSAT